MSQNSAVLSINAWKYMGTNFNSAAFEVWEWTSSFIPHFIMDMNTVSIFGLKLININKVSDYILDFDIAWQCIYPSVNVAHDRFRYEAIAKTNANFLSIEPFELNISYE